MYTEVPEEPLECWSCNSSEKAYTSRKRALSFSHLNRCDVEALKMQVRLYLLDYSTYLSAMLAPLIRAKRKSAQEGTRLRAQHAEFVRQEMEKLERKKGDTQPHFQSLILTESKCTSEKMILSEIGIKSTLKKELSEVAAEYPQPCFPSQFDHPLIVRWVSSEKENLEQEAMRILFRCP